MRVKGESTVLLQIIEEVFTNNIKQRAMDEKYLNGCGEDLFNSMPVIYFLLLPGTPKKERKKGGYYQAKYPCKPGDLKGLLTKTLMTFIRWRALCRECIYKGVFSLIGGLIINKSAIYIVMEQGSLRNMKTM